MHLIIFKFGPIILYSFSFFLALGFLLGSFVIWREGRDEGYSEEKLFDTVFISFVFSIVLSRIFYVALHFDFFGMDVIRWFLFFHYPGFSFWGGFIGCVLGMIFSARSKELFKKFADVFVLGLSVAVIFGDLGCFFGGCMVGSPAKLPWAIVFPGYMWARHPVSIYLMILDIITMFLVFKVFSYLKAKKDLSDVRYGLLGFFYLSIFFVTRGASELYKDKYYNFVPLFLIVLGFAFIIIFYKRIGRSFKSDVKTILMVIYGKINYIKEKIKKKGESNGQPVSQNYFE